MDKKEVHPQHRDLHIFKYREIPYAEGLKMQETFFNEALQCKADHKPTTHRLISLVHKPVITMGKHAKAENILYSKEFLDKRGIELYTTSRGGDVTYHGPGQLTIYPIIDLEDIGIGVRQYVWSLEEAVIKLLKRYGVANTTRLEGASGVWLPAGNSFNKVCAVGIYCSRYITMHGIAFNVDMDTSVYNLINPCGFVDKGVTTMAQLTGRTLAIDKVEQELIDLLAAEWGLHPVAQNG